MKKKFNLTGFLMLLMSIAVLSACQFNATTTPNPDSPVSSDDPINTPPVTDFTGYQQNVYVDKMEVYILESFPLQVAVKVTGNLPDGCTTIVGSESKRLDENTFEIFIYTDRPEDTSCTMALVPFEETIMLDVAGLPAGTYIVTGYGSESSFTFDMDNQ